jgi:hypothetical protein
LGLDDLPGFESRFGRNPGIREIGNPGVCVCVCACVRACVWSESRDSGNRESRFGRNPGFGFPKSRFGRDRENPPRAMLEHRGFRGLVATMTVALLPLAMIGSLGGTYLCRARVGSVVRPCDSQNNLKPKTELNFSSKGF